MKQTFIHINKPLLIKCQAFCLSAFLSFTSTAQANWLEQGADLLKGMQSSQSTDNEKKTNSALPSNLSSEEIQRAFKQALTQGTTAVVDQLGSKNGFNSDPKIHIPLPKSLKTAQDTMNHFGMGKYMDELETKLNRAAEAATPEAKTLFINAIKDLSFEDVQKIYQGPQDSATQYLKEKTSPELRKKMQPIITESLQEVGALKTYDKAISKYKDLPFVPDIKADLQEHVLTEGLDGMFYYIAKEEAAIRKDPVKQSTELLKKVFGN